MDASLTFRFPSLAPAEESARTSSPPASEPTQIAASDETLLTLVSAGSQEALALLFRRYARTVRSVAYRVLRDTSEADDLVQDVFVLVHRDCRAFDSSKAPARFWILQMAYRRAISRRRYLTSRHFYTRLDLDDAGSQVADPATLPAQLNDSIDRRLENGRLDTVFATLSEDQRQTLRFFFTEGYTLDEIADKLGQSRGNVKHHYFRGLEKLRKELFGSKLPGERAV
jgi:RNA polymerase sigma-70 factor, ECF subfamily